MLHGKRDVHFTKFDDFDAWVKSLPKEYDLSNMAVKKALYQRYQVGMFWKRDGKHEYECKVCCLW